jgi:hypothetical protein
VTRTYLGVLPSLLYSSIVVIMGDGNIALVHSEAPGPVFWKPDDERESKE